MCNEKICRLFAIHRDHVYGGISRRFLSTGRLVFEFEQARLESTKLFIRTGVEQPLCVDRHRGLANLACSQRGVDSAGFDSLGAAMDIERGVVVVIFGLNSPAIALLEIVVLWGAILAFMLMTRRQDRWAMSLFAPYFLWVSFATVLNATLWYLNR